MKKLLFLLFFGSSFCVGAQTLWSEDFAGEANGATNGVAAGAPGGTWSVTTAPSSGTFSRQSFLGAGYFQVNNTTNEGVWSTNTISIASVGYAIMSSDIITIGLGFSNSDYVRFYYSLDGGPETLFAEVLGTFFSATTNVSAIVAGSTLKIVVRAVDNSGLGIVGIDNVSIVAAPIIYSRKSGTWTDVTGGVGGTGTWSLVSHVGAACGCVPLNTQVAAIGNAHTVTLPVSQTATDPGPNNAPGAVDIKNTGVLQFNTNGVTLGVQKGLVRVQSGGTINSSGAGITGEQISFNADVGGAKIQVDVGGTASIQDLVIGAAATNFHFISGGGSLTITNDILINATGAGLANDFTGTLSVATRLAFGVTGTVTGSTFTNNQALSLPAIIVNDNADDNNIVANTSTLTLTGATSINPTSANFFINNSGTINQAGNFAGLVAASDFTNQTNGTWNWTLTPNSPLIANVTSVLICTATNNTFNYSGGGAQDIINVNYNNLTLSNSGVKSATGSFSVSGNWLRSGTATFTPGANTVTLNGTTAQNITAVSGETFSGLTTNNSFVTSPQITLNSPVTVTGILIMTAGSINLNSNSFTISSSTAGALNHSGASTAGWMYGGNLIRNIPTSAIAIGNVNGLFPLGSSADFRPFNLGKTNLASSGGLITLSHTNSAITSNVSIADAGPVATIVKRHDSYWTVSTSGISAGSFSLRAGGTGFGTVGTVSGSPTNLRMCITAAPGVVATHSAATGTISDPRVNRINLVFGELTNEFHVGSTDAVDSPLPITLLSFEATLKNEAVELKWRTAQEINNDFFTIEKSTDGEGFEKVIQVRGQGNSEKENSYSFIDSEPYVGTSYYRLKQTDYDGKFTHSKLVAVNYDGSVTPSLNVYANPFNGRKVTVEIRGLKKLKDIPVVMYNLQGQKILERKMTGSNTGIIREELIFEPPLLPGLFIIKAGPTLNLTRKVVVE